MEPLSKLNHHQHIHIILWQVSKLYLFLCDFCKKMCIRVSRVTNAVTNSQKHVDTPLLAAYHLFTQNLFILLPPLIFPLIQIIITTSAITRTIRTIARAVLSIFLYWSITFAFWTRQMKYRSRLSFGRSGSAVHLRLRLLLW